MTRPPSRDPARLVGALRWGLAGTLALALHAAVMAFIVHRPTPVPFATGGATLIAIDLDPVEGSDAKTPDDAPPPDAVGDPEVAAAAASAAAASAEQPSPPEAAQRDTPPAAVPAPPPPPAPTPDAMTAPPPLPDPAEPPAPVRISPPPQPPAPSSSAATGAEAAEERAPAVRHVISGAEAAWRGKLVAHLNRFRRFPPGVADGTAHIGFTLDARGRVENLHVAASSGDAGLDAAASAIVARASPFPVPPAGTEAASLIFVVPIRFDGRHR